MQISKEIKQKLDAFLRRYYSLKLLKGAVLGLGLLGVYFLVISGLEYGFRFGALARMVLFYSFLGLGALVFGLYIFWPVLQLLRMGKTMSYQEASRLIGRHFPEIDDKLLNLLQLGASEAHENTLLLASIEQKSAQLSPYNFAQALDVRSALRYWPALAVPLLVVLGLLLGGKIAAFGEAGGRVLRYSEEFRPAFPFDIELLSDMAVERGEEYVLQVKFSGKQFPEEMVMEANEQAIRLVNRGKGVFEHRFSPLLQQQRLAFVYAGLRSPEYDLQVLEVPQLNDFLVEITPPAYTGFKPEIKAVENVMTIAEGTALRFVAKPTHTKTLYLQHADSSLLAFERSGGTDVLMLNKVQEDMTYHIVGSFEGRMKELSPTNNLSVLKDVYPKISVEWLPDSLDPNKLYYRYNAEDDYGILGVQLKVNASGKQVHKQSVSMEGSRNSKVGFGFVALDEVYDQSGAVEVFLEVADNDGVNGSKVGKSAVYNTKALNKEDYQRFMQQQLGAVSSEKSEVNERMKQQQRFMQSQLDKLKRGEYKWKDKKELTEMLKKQEALLEKKQELDKKQEALREKKGEEKPEDVRNKDKEDEIKDLIDEIQRLKDKLGMEDLEKKLKKLEELTSQMNQQEQRQEMLEEQLESERAILEAIDKLQELAKKEEQLSKQNEQTEQQEKLNREFESVKKEVEEQLEENKAFEQAAEKEGLEDKMEQAAGDMQKAGEQQNKPSKQSSQKKASESLKEMAEGLQNAFMAMQAQSEEEDAEMLRRILENVELLSFGSERVLNRTKQIQRDDPVVRKLLLEQNKLITGTGVIRDSLTALANRNPRIKQKVFEELSAIASNQQKSLEEMQNVELMPSASHQQYVMLAANNLALMLDASLQNMRAAMAQSKPGDQNCQKPGGKKPGKSGLAKAQAELAKQMQEQMQGKKPGKQGKWGAEGKEGADGEQGNAGELARIISQQEQLRNAYKQQMDAEKKGGGVGGDALEELMKEVEKDLYNNTITQETLDRVKEIETRLLEDERAERKQERDDQRQSETDKGIKQEESERLEFLRRKAREREALLYEELMLRQNLGGNE
jgi:hypothetical protein